MVKLSEEVAEALKAANGDALSVEVPGFDRRFVVVEKSEYDAAMEALALQRNAELIREGVADVESGRVMPLHEAMEQIRQELGFPRRQTT
jgi:PHD/YefM family antitoxin component YafN of YafNO toxin-antitoxin module